MCTHVLGIDIAQDTFDVALRNGKDVCGTGHFDNCDTGFESLHRWLENRKVDSLHACMEATSRYGIALATFLHAQGYDVSIVNPSRIRHYGRSQLSRTKTDKADALLIADFCVTQAPSLWEPPSDFHTELQALNRYLNDLKANRAQEKTRLDSGIPSHSVKSAIQDHIDFLDDQIKQVEKEIKELLKQDDEYRQQLKLLTSIPGIGLITALNFLAEVPDISAFPQARQLAAFAGLCPTEHRSGTSVRKKSRLSKTGSKRLRTIFFMSALTVKKNGNPLISPLIDRMEKEGRADKIIIGAIMRKLLHLAYGVLKTGKPFDPQYLSGPLGA